MQKMGMFFSMSNSTKPLVTNTLQHNKTNAIRLNTTRKPSMGVFISMNMSTRVGGCGCGK